MVFENTLTKKIEIAAPPAEVREKFFQWDQLSKYHPNGFFKVIRPLTPDTPLAAGNKLHVEIEVGTMDPTIVENTPSKFCWGGRGLGGTFNGNHAFHFTESKTTPGATTFVQEEVFSGLLAFLMGDGAVAGMAGLKSKTSNGFEKFNEDFKRWVEEGSVVRK